MLSGSGSIHSPNACFLSTYYVLPTVIAFKVKIMNKAEALGEEGSIKQTIAIWSERLGGKLREHRSLARMTALGSGWNTPTSKSTSWCKPA